MVHIVFKPILLTQISTDKMSLKYEKITKDIIGGAFEVYNVLGIELKVAAEYNPKDEAQLLNQLKATEKEMAYLSILEGKKLNLNDLLEGFDVLCILTVTEFFSVLI